MNDGYIGRGDPEETRKQKPPTNTPTYHFRGTDYYEDAF